MSSETKPTEILFDEISRYIADSHVLLKSGSYIELAGLENHVRKLCTAPLEMSQDERLRHGERLQQLLYSLGELEETMMHYRDAMAEETRHLSSHKKANVAYRTSEAIDDYKREEE